MLKGAEWSSEDTLGGKLPSYCINQTPLKDNLTACHFSSLNLTIKKPEKKKRRKKKGSKK